LETLCNDVELIRQASGEERVAVLGHSTGGLLALEYARHYPKSVNHVLMIGTPPHETLDTSKPEPEFGPELKEFWNQDASPERKALLRQNQEQLTPERISQVPPGKAFGVWYTAHGPMAFYDASYDISWIFEGLEFDLGVFSHFTGTFLKDYNIDTAIREASVPVFLALGRYDYLVPSSLWDEYKEKVPNLTVRIYEQSGHYPMMEESQRFDKDLLDWLGI
jgi:proline iminopeptidase